MLIISNMGDHVWLMTSRQTLPLLPLLSQFPRSEREEREGGRKECIQFVDIRVEDAVDEADGWAFIRILVWELDVDLPVSASKGG